MSTATEVLEEILKKVSSLEKEINKNNFLLQTLLARSNNEPKKEKGPPKIVATDAIQSVTQQAQLPQQQAAQQPAKVPQQFKTPEQPITPQQSLQEEKFVVLQLIARDKTPIFLANISVYNSKQEVVYQGTTSANGQWNTVLPPGDYTVSIKKGPGTKVPEIDITDSFSVSASKVKNGKITLNSIKI